MTCWCSGGRPEIGVSQRMVRTDCSGEMNTFLECSKLEHSNKKKMEAIGADLGLLGCGRGVNRQKN